MSSTSAVTSRRSALRCCPLHLQLSHPRASVLCVCLVPKNFRSSFDSLGACCTVPNCMDLLAVDLGCRQTRRPYLDISPTANCLVCKVLCLQSHQLSRLSSSCPAAMQQLLHLVPLFFSAHDSLETSWFLFLHLCSDDT